MMNSNFFDDLSKKLADAVPQNVKAARADLEKHFRQIVQSMFSKMDLITREEFDIQVHILSKTRAKLEKLEEKIKSLEEKKAHKKKSED